MKGAPWFKFWVADFRGGTLEFSNAEVGAYIRLLLAQWEQGSLPSEPESLAMIACGPVSSRVLGKFKAGEDGRLRSSRMEEERTGATKRSLMGEAGANARWNADRNPEAMPNGCGPHAVGNADRNAENRGQSTEDRVQNTEARKQKKYPASPDGLPEFWEAYPRKVAKAAAARSWKAIKNKPPLAEIMSALERQKASPDWQKDGGKYIPYPATWINQRRWEDEGENSAPRAHDPDHIPTQAEVDFMYAELERDRLLSIEEAKAAAAKEANATR